ncbi:hypothetical protein PIB30_051334 [Stylosanthes scabra]|uniref:Uncharacterized protein n=1 Tax=Stylosanthes scabra TaxID=79078 RepID=A0ABU6VHJ3_9FABA|nr:hypothetical protein [Stylosanthes scabra]
MRRVRVGRPRTTRIRTNMDDVDPNRPRRCGLCRQVGQPGRIVIREVLLLVMVFRVRLRIEIPLQEVQKMQENKPKEDNIMRE